MCYTGFEDSGLFPVRGGFSVQFGLYRDAQCSDQEFFMYQFVKPDECRVSPGSSASASEIYKINHGVNIRIDFYSSVDCSNLSTSTAAIALSDCVPFTRDPSNSSNILSYAKGLALTPEAVETALPPSQSMSPTSATSSASPLTRPAHTMNFLAVENAAAFVPPVVVLAVAALL
jgi:hypothetical protein